jgi:hypothetical protein
MRSITSTIMVMGLFACAAPDGVETDESCTKVMLFADRDGDGTGGGEAFEACLVDPDALPAATAKIGGDCDDGLADVSKPIIGYADTDDDGVTTGGPIEHCLAALPTGFRATARPDDCNDHDATVWQLVTYYADADGDGYGDLGTTTMSCTLTPPTGFALDGSDPNDGNPQITPLDTDGDLVANANDCAVSDATRWRTATVYTDADGDDWTIGTGASQCIGMLAPAGKTLIYTPEDCNDQDPAVAWMLSVWPDGDGDGYGSGTGTQLCVATPPMGYAANNMDCNDGDPMVRYLIGGYVDGDGDGFGTGGQQTFCAAQLPSGYANQTNDCNDADPTVHGRVYGWVDGDGDGYGVAPYTGVCATSLPAGYAPNNYDTNDGDPAINVRKVTASVYQPSASGHCNGSYCSGVIVLILGNNVPTEVTVSAYSRTMWCIYGRSNTDVTRTTVMGYELNTISRRYMCGLSSLRFACNGTYMHGGVTYSKISIGPDQCVPDYGTAGSYITNYDTYSASVLVR